MTCFTLLFAALLPQTPAAAPAPTPAEVWQQVQDRYGSAEVVGFRAEGRVLSTLPASAGRTLARIEAEVEVARSGLGSVQLSIQAGQGKQGKSIRLASLGTAEGVFSLDCEQNCAYSRGADWASSGELEDFDFLGSAWTGSKTRVGQATAVSFVPREAEHPGLQGLRVRSGQDPQHLSTTIFWLDQKGLVRAADVRIDSDTVLHWTFHDSSLRSEFSVPMEAVALPAGCKREDGQPVEATAVPAPTETAEPASADRK